jgi:hypothetical protein
LLDLENCCFLKNLTRSSYRMSTGGRLIKLVIIFFRSEVGGVNFRPFKTASLLSRLASQLNRLASQLCWFASQLCWFASQLTRLASQLSRLASQLCRLTSELGIFASLYWRFTSESWLLTSQFWRSTSEMWILASQFWRWSSLQRWFFVGGSMFNWTSSVVGASRGTMTVQFSAGLKSQKKWGKFN